MNRPNWTAIATQVVPTMLLLASSSALAAPGTLSQKPLFIGTQVNPNVVFLIDDSGSMDWEVITEDYNNNLLFTNTQRDGGSAPYDGSAKHRDSDEDGRTECGFGSGSYYGYLYGVEFESNAYSDDGNDCNTADDEEWRFRNSDFNPLYFDPAKIYLPWAGVDRDGDPFRNIDITNAPDDPYDPDAYIDLTRHNSNWAGGSSRATGDRDRDGKPDGFRYYTWNDADGDGNFDNGEETEHKIQDADAATQQNFANWFSYYRSRMLMAKAAYGRVIAGADNLRIGFISMNSRHNRVPVDDVTGDPASGHKRELLDELYSLKPGGGTPLRDAAYNCGRYLDCASNDYFSACPALAAGNGGECQQNFMILMTDGFYNGSFGALRNEDGDGNTDFDGGPYGDNESDTMGDIAMYFYERDIHPGLEDLVPITAGIDEATHQHVVTYTIGYGVNGTLSEMPPVGATTFDWPDHDDGNAEKIDDLRHAAYNGRGLFLSAENPNDLAKALNDAVTDIAERSGSAAAVAFNTSSLETDTEVYLSLFNSTRWGGTLVAKSLDDEGNVEKGNAWDAAKRLDERTAPRTILSYGGSGGIAFQWDDLPSAHKADLRTNPSGGTDSDTIAEARLDFLRGDRSHEGTGYGFRIRSSRMGDVVYSAPVYVGPAEQAWPENMPGAGPYDSFKQNVYGRTPIVYVGANDGMLHGFNAATGDEVMAYVPGLVVSTGSDEGLHYLTDPGYRHRYYVDLSPTVADAGVGGAWKTVLVGGLRAGGRGYFALDVTDPSQFSEDNADAVVLWEFGENDDPDVGHSFARPVVAPLNNGRWAVIFGNGYNDTGSGEAQLFILFIEAGTDGTWSASDYVKISTGVGSSGNRNGLSTPAVVDLNFDSIADRVYAGDLFGNLWAFDLRSDTPSDWAVAHQEDDGTPVPLLSTGQPITTSPRVTRAPGVETRSDNYPNTMVYFGTGQYITLPDVVDTTVQSFYGVWDNGTSDLSQEDLVEQTVVTRNDVRTMETNPVPLGSVYGCFFDLPESGERVVTDPVVRGERIFFNTLVPSTTACSGGGTSWLMSVNLDSCGAPEKAIFDLNDDGVIDSQDMVNGEAPVGEKHDGVTADPNFRGNKQYNPNTNNQNPGNGGENNPGARLVEALMGVRNGRLSWQELQD